ncbi:hypothetical protein [Algicella marina]|uniref:Phage tail protein n=1 Tax=Algicella marina TaxID=2683284 RepID=A0A6P1T5A6_9RHOB|nr:hypothetical protein [Algicella marina]QHQ36666.1 hypothetical protein GO499_16545 [Algicella marina]
MNRITPEALYRLLPAVHRLRDADEGQPLRALTAILAREGAVVEENIEQLLDNLFIETCEDWAAPYVGGTIGYRPLYRIEGTDVGNRAEVANTIGYRRRKGTAAVLEQLARDVTGWPAHVVEYFQLTATCQHMNHIRADHHLGPDLHDPLAMEPLNKAFDGTSRTVDARSIQQSPSRQSIGGKHNLPNIGLHLWRLIPMAHTQVPATQVDARRFLFDPLGAPRQLVNWPEPETTIASISEPRHLPGHISRRALEADMTAFTPRAFTIFVGGTALSADALEACDLSDDGPGWNHAPHPAPAPGDPPQRVRVDPALGRISFPEDQGETVATSFHTAFPARIGGGEYNRAASFRQRPEQMLALYPSPDHATLQDAVNAISTIGGIVEITENGVFEETVTISAGDGAEVVLRAADGIRPILRLDGILHIQGAADARVTLDGLVLERRRINIRENPDGISLKEVTFRHCTLVPGRAFSQTGEPANPNAIALTVSTTGLELFLDRSISGPIRMHETTNAEIRDSIVDAASADSGDSPAARALFGTGPETEPAGALTIIASTVIGRIYARAFPLVSDSILLARTDDGSAPVRAVRRQQGCIRFTWLPQDSVTPRRYRCQPQLAIDHAIAIQEQLGAVSPATRGLITSRITRWLRPSFTALTASHPAYCQLRDAAPFEIREGASDDGEMGVWHLIAAPQREANLRIRLEEYLRFGLEAGIFHET